MWCSLTRVATVLALLYLSYNIYVVYTIFNPPSCTPGQEKGCLVPAYDKGQKLQLWVYVSTTKSSFTSKAKLLYHNDSFLRTDRIETVLNVTVPSSTLKNGSLYTHVFLGPFGRSPSNQADRAHLSYSSVPLTKHAVAQSSAFKLLANSEQAESGSEDLPVTHWIPWLHIHSLSEDWRFDMKNIPPEFYGLLRLSQNQYLPLLHVDRIKVRNAQLKPISKNMTLDLTYEPVSIGKLRLWLIFFQAMDSMKSLGFSEKEFDDMKGIFLDTDFWLFGLTIFISVFHLLFDFLAFKNDISFWRHRKTMVGLSMRTVVWRCFSQAVVFLYLMDSKASLLVLIPIGVGTVIEFWKVTKAFKVTITWTGFLPKIERGEKLQQELETESLDSEAMAKLSYLLYPLVLVGAAYQLFYASHKSWYSWMIQSLVNGVYAFGFLFMLPQLFLNYKMKSVAHLPWRVFMYKAFNTFIDDVFAFIITMPTSHRIAVFRDDAVFLVYLYQRWLYPVDKSRVNEYGESFDTDQEHAKKD